LRRALQKFVESPLSLSLLGGEFTAGDTIQVDVNSAEDHLSFHRVEAGVEKSEMVAAVG